jgi:hypothetical protein
MRPTLVGLCLLFVATTLVLPARACINDREVNRSEREFKSQYQQPSPGADPTGPPAAPQSSDLPLVFLGGGTVLLLGAGLTVLNLRKPPTAA